MSLSINTDKITAVLLSDGWHDIWPGSFCLDSYEFMHEHPNPDRDDVYVHLGGNSGVCATGFTVKTDGDLMSGPLTTILAVRHSDT